MRHKGLTRFVARTAPLLAVASSGWAAPDAAQLAAMQASRSVDAAAISDSRRAQDWLSTGRTYSEQRYSPLKQITSANAHELGLAWSLDLPSKGTLEATPLVAYGILYTTGSFGVVFAVDAKSGALLWTYDPKAQLRAAEAVVWDRHRGLALYKGKIYVGVADGRLIALDAVDGHEVWTAQTFDRHIPYAITGAPRVFDGRVVIGMSGGDIGTRGYASAYDAETGKLLWRFYAVPGNPEDGFESKAMEMAAKTWRGEWWKYGGGGNPWNAFSYDPKLGLVYIAFANGGPWTQTNRSPGGGDNLFLSSIVAVRADTGEYVWHYQNTPGEEWDFDATTDMILADIVVDGNVRQVLMQAPKNGFFYVLDRKTGKLLSAKNFVNVTWTDGIDMGTGRPVPKSGAHFENGAVDIAPGFAGGHSWYPMSYSPKTNLSYFSWRDASAVVSKPDNKDWHYSPGIFDMPIIAPSPKQSDGGILAWDPTHQREAWRISLPTKLVGGTAVTAGNVVFAGTGDGRLLAVDATSGKQLWEGATDNAVMGGPSIYSVDGVEYIAVMAGIGGVFSQEPILKSFGYRYGTGRRLLAFRLGGAQHLPAMAVLPPEPASRPPSDDPAVQRGKALYGPYCGSCHGPNATNSGGAPELRRSTMLSALPTIVLGGTLVPAGMPSFKKYLSDAQVADLQAYLLDRAAAAPPPVAPP
jgi:quinohemoprotein ethanol dehydrogenase